MADESQVDPTPDLLDDMLAALLEQVPEDGDTARAAEAAGAPPVTAASGEQPEAGPPDEQADLSWSSAFAEALLESAGPETFPGERPQGGTIASESETTVAADEAGTGRQADAGLLAGHEGLYGLLAGVGQSTPVSLPDHSEQPSYDNEDLQLQLDEIIARIELEVEAAPIETAVAVPSVEDQRRGARRATDYVVFALAGTHYALALTEVAEMDKVPRLTAVPHTPDCVLGLANLRGDIVALVDLRALLGLSPADPTRGRMLLVRSQAHGEPVSAGLVVDAVLGTAPGDEIVMQRPLGPQEEPVVAYLKGVGEYKDHVLNVLDLERLLAAPELGQLTAA